MNVTLRYRGQLKDMIERGTDAAAFDEGARVKDILVFLKKQYGSAAAKTAGAMLITINGIKALPKEALAEGDCVTFFPICGGG
jgi:molybdopterin converting factor small subunit